MRFAACLAAVFVHAAAIAADDPQNYVTWRPGLASSAQPAAKWLQSIDKTRYDVVVNLAPPQSMGSIANEGALVGSKGVTYINIPVDFMHPTAEDFRFFTEVLRANKDRRVLVHCQINLRGSSFTFLYRVIHEDAAASEATAKLTGVWNPDPVWRKFIEETLAAHGKRLEIL